MRSAHCRFVACVNACPGYVRDQCTLFSESKLLDQFEIARSVGSGQIPQKPVSASNQHEQASSARMILVVVLEVALKCIDPLGENGNLYFRRTRVCSGSAMFTDERGFLLLGDGHVGSVWSVHIWWTGVPRLRKLVFVFPMNREGYPGGALMARNRLRQDSA